MGDDIPRATATDPTLYWIQRTRTDPVLAAITQGTSLGAGEALAVSRWTVARVSLATGRVLDLVDLTGAYECRAVRAGVEAWVVCSLVRSAGKTVKALRVTSLSPLTVTPIDWQKRFLSPQVLRGSRSGALFFFDTDGALLLQATGAKPLSWPTVDARDDSTWTKPAWTMGRDSVLPLSDGHLAFLRVHGAEHELGSLAEGGKEGIVARLPKEWTPIRLVTEDDPERVRVLGWRRHASPEIATVDSAGFTTIAAVPGLSCPTEGCAWQLEIDETRGIALRIDVGMASIARRAPESMDVSIAAAAVTRDGGRTFSPMRVPPEAITGAARHLVVPEASAPTVHAVANDVGMVVGGMARIGWDPADDAASGE
jgi:hypothetical protein